jgi:hypothetical protein
MNVERIEVEISQFVVLQNKDGVSRSGNKRRIISSSSVNNVLKSYSENYFGIGPGHGGERDAT